MNKNNKKYNLVCSIVLYENNQKVLERTLKSIYYSNLNNIKICLIDNSHKKLIYIDELKLKYPEIDYIHSEKNLGYGSANNVVMKKYLLNCKYFLVLNPDVEFKEDTLSRLFEFMNLNIDCGLCGVQINNLSGGIQYANKRLPNPFDVSIRFIGSKLPLIGNFIKKIFKKDRNKYKLKDLNHNKNILCPVISGCFMFFRAKVLEELGGFDPRFFMYYDDVDLSRRVFRKYKVILLNDVKIKHGWQRTSYKQLKLLKYHIKSTFKYFNKWGWFFDKERKKINLQAKNI